MWLCMGGGGCMIVFRKYIHMKFLNIGCFLVIAAAKPGQDLGRSGRIPGADQADQQQGCQVSNNNVITWLFLKTTGNPYKNTYTTEELSVTVDINRI